MTNTAFPAVQLGKLVDKISNPVQVNPITAYQQIGVRSHGKGIFDKELVIGKELGTKRVFWVEPDCFIVNIVFAWEQAVARTSFADKGKIASHRFPMFRPKQAKADVDYLTYLFKTKLGKHLLALASPGGAGRNKTLGQSEFLKMLIPCPPVREQRRIADILLTWDRAIETTEKLIAHSQSLKKALIQQLLTGKKRLLSDDGVQFSGEWISTSFDKVLNIEIGGTPSRAHPEYWDDKKLTNNRWLSIANLQGSKIYDTSEYISHLGVENSNVKLIPSGTIVMSFKLTIGRKAVLMKHCYTNEAICALLIKDKKQLDNEYLYHALTVVKFDTEIDQAVKGKTLNKEKLNRLKLELPSLEEQQKITNVLSNADAYTETLQRTADLLKQEKANLMQQLLTGKRRVNINGEEAAYA